MKLFKMCDIKVVIVCQDLFSFGVIFIYVYTDCNHKMLFYIFAYVLVKFPIYLFLRFLVKH